MAEFSIRENVPLAPMTTLGVGGPARFFAEAGSERDVAEAVEYAASRSLPLFVLGGGSNILVADEGFDGLVLRISIRGKHFEDAGERTAVTAGAGEDWDAFVADCVEREFSGAECLSGIPGSVGGTPVQNVGAYGQEVSETIVSVRCFDRTEAKFKDLSNAECGFAYRTSIFNSTEKDRYIVTGVTYDLLRGGEPKIVYKDLKEYFCGQKPTLGETRRAVLGIRRAKSMVIDPKDRNSRSAGSFFKNPVVAAEKAAEIASRPGIGDMPRFPAGGGAVKIPAAWLIEKAGFRKGFQLGRAGISENHSLAIVNRGGATAAEIVALKELIQSRVSDQFGIELRPEPVMVGI